MLEPDLRAESGKRWTLVIYWEKLGFLFFESSINLPTPNIEEDLKLPVIALIPPGNDNFKKYKKITNSEGEYYELIPWNGNDTYESYMVNNTSK